MLNQALRAKLAKMKSADSKIISNDYSSTVLSIITPCYNAEKYIADCIESVVAQGCPSLEHIIIDGASQDRTIAILREKATQYRHIQFVSEPDRGQSDAMNKGIRMARAEYISILNVDDFYEPGVLARIARLIEGLREPRFIVGACNVLGEGDKLCRVNRPKVLDLDNILAGAPFPNNPSAYFYPKSIHETVGYYDVEEHITMDLKFLMAVVQELEPLYIDEILGNFRFIPGTKTFETEQDGTAEKRRREVFRDYFARLPMTAKVRVGVLRKVWWARRHYWRLWEHFQG
jgi:glycosyltransferase involved in cell wall biosynthesis